jgi:hypothetical protein
MKFMFPVLALVSSFSIGSLFSSVSGAALPPPVIAEVQASNASIGPGGPRLTSLQVYETGLIARVTTAWSGQTDTKVVGEVPQAALQALLAASYQITSSHEVDEALLDPSPGSMGCVGGAHLVYIATAGGRNVRVAEKINCKQLIKPHLSQADQVIAEILKQLTSR